MRMKASFFPKKDQEKTSVKVTFPTREKAQIFTKLVNDSDYFTVAVAKKVEVRVTLNTCYNLGELEEKLESLYDQAINSNPSDYQQMEETNDE